MKIIDCFPYFNESELLELRIKMYYNYVDRFIITDGDHTYSGVPKPFTCRRTLQQLGIPLDKIEVVEVAMPSYEQEPDNWIRERMQRNVAAKFFEDDAVHIVADCDELVDPRHLHFYAQSAVEQPDKLIRINMYHLNCRANLVLCHPDGTPQIWQHPYIATKKHIEHYTLSDLREDFAMKKYESDFTHIFLKDQNSKLIPTGWHFSWMGNKERIKFKMASFAHAYDGKNDIFSTAVADIPSLEMQHFLDQYQPDVGSTDPYGRPENILQNYPIELLPDLIFHLPRVKDFLFQGKF